MKKESNIGIRSKIKNKFYDYIGNNQGVSGTEVQGLMRDPKPYSSYTTNGIFTGYDDSMFIYYAMPQDVQVYWTKTEDEALINQFFLTNVINSIGESIIEHDSQSTKNDSRIRYHIVGVREQTNEIKIPGITTPAHKDYIDRMGGFMHSEWHFYLGLEMQKGSIFEDVYGIQDQALRYVEWFNNRESMDYELYRESLNLYNSIAIENGLRPLDFYTNPEDFARLTAWYGQDDSYYGVRRELQTTPIFIPETGKSIFSGGRELSFHSISPVETSDLFMVNPKNERDVAFGKELFAPENNVVHINIRGQIRSPVATKNIFNDKLIFNEYTDDSGKYDKTETRSEQRRLMEQNEKISIAAMEAEKLNASWLDHTSIVVATVIDGKPQLLNANLSPYSLKATNLLHRQGVALCSTVPCYPQPIFTISKKNNTRNPNVNSFYSGVLSASGLFRSTRYSAESGIFLGLSSEGHEYIPVYTDPDDSLKYGAPPIVILTGDTGSGKSVQMLNMLAQTVYLGKLAIMINPKKSSTAKGMFDLLGGITIKMSSDYMRKHPGQLDPLFYIEDREQAGRVLADMIIAAMKYNYSNGENAISNAIATEALTAEIIERAKMRANECSWDVIAGNKRVNPPTPKISNDSVIEFVQNRMKTSAFWKSSISRDPEGRSAFKNAISSGKPILIEWDGSIVLPDKETTPDKYTPSQQDGIQSVLNIFNYASEILGNARQGGMLAIDEAHHLKRSPTIMSKLTTSGREWRSSGITLMLASQEVLDFLNPDDVDISSYVRLFIFMHIAPEDNKNLERFLEIVSLEDSEKLKQFITNAKPGMGSPYPGAFIRDRTTNWDGGIICGKFPEREMSAIKSGEKNSAHKSSDYSSNRRNDGFGTTDSTDQQLLREIDYDNSLL